MGSGGLGGALEDLTGIDMGDSSSTDRALAAQRNATRDANATQKYMYDTTREDQRAWREAGEGALKDLASDDFKRDFGANDFQADPGYAFRMAEGQKALERSAAARGSLISGGQMKALANYSQNAASAEYQNAYNRFNADRDRRFGRLSSIAGIGQNALAQTGAAGQSYANNVSQNQLGLGNAEAGAHIAQGNRFVNLVEQGVKAYATGGKAPGGGGGVTASDMSVKKNIEAIPYEDLIELRATVRPYLFNYIDDQLGKGDWVGVMAQDLQKSKLGRKLVVVTEAGHLGVDMNKFGSLLLALLSVGY